MTSSVFKHWLSSIIMLAGICWCQTIINHLSTLSFDLLALGWLYVTRNSTQRDTLILAALTGFLAESQSLIPRGMMIMTYVLAGGLMIYLRTHIQTQKRAYVFYSVIPALSSLTHTILIKTLYPHLLWTHFSALITQIWLSLLVQTSIVIGWLYWQQRTRYLSSHYSGHHSYQYPTKSHSSNQRHY